MQRIAAAASLRAVAPVPVAGQPAAALAALQVVGPIASRTGDRAAPGLLAFTRSLASAVSSCWAPPPLASAAAHLLWQHGDVRQQPPVARLRTSCIGRIALQGGFSSSAAAAHHHRSGRPGYCWHASSAAAAAAAVPGCGSVCSRGGSEAWDAIYTRCVRTAVDSLAPLRDATPPERRRPHLEHGLSAGSSALTH